MTNLCLLFSPPAHSMPHSFTAHPSGYSGYSNIIHIKRFSEDHYTDVLNTGILCSLVFTMAITIRETTASGEDGSLYCGLQGGVLLDYINEGVPERIECCRRQMGPAMITFPPSHRC